MHTHIFPNIHIQSKIADFLLVVANDCKLEGCQLDETKIGTKFGDCR